MKIFKSSFVKLFAFLLLATSCTDFVEPNIPYATFDTGAYLRTITRTSTTFNFFDLPNSKFDITVEAVDAEDGKTVESVEVRVRHRRLVPGVGNVFKPAAGAGGAVVDVSVKTFTAADFKPNDQSRFLRANIQLTASEILTKLGLTAAQINGGDAFEIRLTLRDNKGRVFNDVNASGDVKGGAFFSSPFLYPVSVVCPVDDKFALGTYSLKQTEGPADPFFGNATRFVEENVTLKTVTGNSTRRVFDVKYLGGFTTRPFTIEFSCGNVIKPKESAGAGCGGTLINWVSDNANLAAYSPTNDKTIIINFVDDSDSSCGIKAPVQFTLTKI